METPVQKHESDEHIVPKWIKTAGALAGIMVALLGALVGIYQVVVSLRQMDVNIQKEQRASDEAKAKEAEEIRKKAEAETQRSAADAAANIQLKQKDVDIKNAELSKERTARESMLLGIKKEVEAKTLEEKFKVEEQERAQKRLQANELTGTLLDVFKFDRSVPSLANLAKYVVPGDERLPGILTSLVAKLDAVYEPAEVNIIFQLFERAGPIALGSVIDSNRNAFERYKSTSKKLALVQFDVDRKMLLDRLGKESTEPIALFPLFAKSATCLIGEQDPRSDLAGLQRAHIEDVWDQILLSLIGRTFRNLMNSGVSESPSVPPDALLRLDLALGPETPAALSRDLSLQVTILRQSKRSLLRLLKQTQEPVDLSGTDLSGIKLRPDVYGPINFSEAFVGGADFSDANFAPETVFSLGEAYVTREQRVRQKPNTPRIRLAPDQIIMLSSRAER